MTNVSYPAMVTLKRKQYKAPKVLPFALDVIAPEKLRGSDAIRLTISENRDELELKHPDVLTSIKLRKQLAVTLNC